MKLRKQPIFRAKPCHAWAAMWRSANEFTGISARLLYNGRVPVIFKTRKEAVDFINSSYGYIRKRPDLRSHPHGWRIPIPVRVTIAATK